MVRADRTVRRRWLVAPVLVALLTLILSAGGIALALRQGRVVYEARIRGLRDHAEVVSSRLQDGLRRLAQDRIGRIHQAFDNRDDAEINGFVTRDAWIELGFVYDGWALITWPATTVARSDRSYEALAPPGYGMAEVAEFVDHNLDEAIKLYERCTGEGTPVDWQLRAQTAIAACRAKQGRYDEAIEIYQRLRTRYTMILRSLDWPSLFRVNLALIDVLMEAGRHAQAVDAADELCRQIIAGQVPLTARQQAEVLMKWLRRLGYRSPEELQTLERQLDDLAERRHHLASAAGVVRTWMEPRLNPPPGAEERGIQFVVDTLGARPRALAYQRFDSRSGEVVVGVCIHLPALYASFVVPNVQAWGRGDLTLGPEGPPDAETAAPWTQALVMPLHAWVLRPAGTFVERVGREVRRQTWIYMGLTAVAVLIMLAATTVLVAAVRHEMVLTRLKNDFVANVSHELKTPLALIRLFGETLLYQRGVDEDKRRTYYEVITRESERLTHLINNILDFSRIDAGHKHYQRADCDIGRLVGQTLEAYRLQLDHHGFDCRVEIEPDLPRVSADADAISQAVLNLLNNAVKYSTDRKRLDVRVQRGRRVDRNGVSIAVADQGIGIRPEERQRLFDSFYRGNNDVVQATRGSGLGLTLVRHIVAGHDGEVRVESEVGRGSTFTIFLPESNHQALEDDHAANTDC